MTHILRAISFLLAVAIATPAFAKWTVAKVTQPATYAVDGKTWKPVRLGMTIPNNAWIHTARRGRVLLQDGADRIQFKPNTVAAVSVKVDGDRQETTVIQKFGSVLLEIDPRARRGTRVDSPYLSAIVKGTLFLVVVTLDGAELVTRSGVVEVTDLVRGARVDVRAGQRVTVPASGRGALTVGGRGPKAPVISVEPGPARVGPPRPATPEGGGAAGGEGRSSRQERRGDGAESLPVRERFDRSFDDASSNRTSTPDEEAPNPVETPEPAPEPENGGSDPEDMPDLAAPPPDVEPEQPPEVEPEQPPDGGN